MTTVKEKIKEWMLNPNETVKVWTTRNSDEYVMSGFSDNCAYGLPKTVNSIMQRFGEGTYERIETEDTICPVIESFEWPLTIEMAQEILNNC